MRALLVGTGRMGRAIETALVARGHAVAGTVSRGGFPPALPEIDIAFEFTTPAAAPGCVTELLRRGIPTVSGSTGWDEAPARALAGERRVSFLHAANFSIGVAVLRRALVHVARDLAAFPEFEAGLLERHHRAKKDAPSGTAKLLAKALGEERAVPIVALRQGGQPGEHTVFFEGESETLELVHRARSRALFAEGAVRAGEWLFRERPPGPVSFDDFFDSLSRSAS